LITGRFANPEIHDTTRRVAFDGSSRHPGFLHQVIRDALAAGRPFEGLALIEALWARMCEGTREDGSTIEPNDPFWDDLNRIAITSKDDPRLWLAQERFYGGLGQNAEFAESFARWLRLVWDQGTEAALRTYLES